MPTLTGVSNTTDFASQLEWIFSQNAIVTNTPTRIVTHGMFTYEYTGTGLVATQFIGFLAGFSAGIMDSLTIRDSVSNAVLAKLAGLDVDFSLGDGIFGDSEGLAAFLAAQKWTMTATGAADVYDLSDLNGFHVSSRNVINLLAGDDTARGGFGVDIINGGTGNDVISDSKGNDVARGGLGDDLLGLGAGANGNDKLYGDIGNDTIWGGLGKDKLYGGAGDDFMMGGTGDDLMNGGKGRDTQDGGAGADTFLFGMADGADVINNFELAFDVLRINLTGDTTTVRITETAGDAIIRFGTTSITLDGIAKADLVIGDHIILI